MGIPFAAMMLFQSAWFGILVTISDGQPHERWWFFAPALTISHTLYFYIALAPAQLIYLLFPQLLESEIALTITFGVGQFIFSWLVWFVVVYGCIHMSNKHLKKR